jgi:hypothetical protein
MWGLRWYTTLFLKNCASAFIRPISFLFNRFWLKCVFPKRIIVFYLLEPSRFFCNMSTSITRWWLASNQEICSVFFFYIIRGWSFLFIFQTWIIILSFGDRKSIFNDKTAAVSHPYSFFFSECLIGSFKHYYLCFKFRLWLIFDKKNKIFSGIKFYISYKNLTNCSGLEDSKTSDIVYKIECSVPDCHYICTNNFTN